jgi:hypothetical protein
MAKAISWGKPGIYIAEAGQALGNDYQWELLATPVEDSTNLTGTQGDKTEATIEGGEAEATKFKAATFELAMNVRMALENNNKHRLLPTPMYATKQVTISGSATDVVDLDNYSASSVAVVLIPEDDKAPGFYCPNASVSIMDTYTAADGAQWEIVLAPNVPSGGGKAVQFGKYTATKKGSMTNVAIGATAQGAAVNLSVQMYSIAKDASYTTYGS